MTITDDEEKLYKSYYATVGAQGRTAANFIYGPVRELLADIGERKYLISLQRKRIRREQLLTQFGGSA